MPGVWSSELQLWPTTATETRNEDLCNQERRPAPYRARATAGATPRLHLASAGTGGHARCGSQDGRLGKARPPALLRPGVARTFAPRPGSSEKPAGFPDRPRLREQHRAEQGALGEASPAGSGAGSVTHPQMSKLGGCGGAFPENRRRGSHAPHPQLQFRARDPKPSMPPDRRGREAGHQTTARTGTAPQRRDPRKRPLPRH